MIYNKQRVLYRFGSLNCANMLNCSRNKPLIYNAVGNQQLHHLELPYLISGNPISLLK